MERQNYYFDIFDKYIHCDMSLVLWISWWPDSMFMFYILEKYLIQIGFDLQKLHIAHFNHNFRRESFDEFIILQNTFSKYKFHSQTFQWDSFTESNLRKARHKFFSEILDWINWDKVLLLWHNLTDRIETTFLNMLRWSSKQWLLNMRMFETAKNYYIFRPLLDTPKDIIIQECYNNWIEYFIDKTNFDSKVSLRNKLRNGPINDLIKLWNKNKDWNNKFFDSFRNFYNLIDSWNDSRIDLQNLILDENWKADYWYKLLSPLDSIQTLVNLLKKLELYNNISKNNLEEIYNYLIKSNDWYKYFNGVYFFKSHGNIYIIKWPLLFWQKRFADIKKIIKIWYISIRNYNISIDKEEYLGWELGFFNSFDPIIRWKLKKVFINKKIPIFNRMFTLVIVKENKILKIYYK